MKNVKPISPDDVKLEDKIPWYIIEAVNDFIKERYNPSSKSSFTIEQDEILKLAFDKCENDYEYESFEDFKRRIFDAKQLDFEDLYSKAGWKVEYDKPGYCESYNAYFKFERK